MHLQKIISWLCIGTANILPLRDPGDMIKCSKGYLELNQGYRNLEDSVMSFFYADSRYEQQSRSYSYKEKLAVVFKTCMDIEEYNTGCRRILNYDPIIRICEKKCGISYCI